MEYINALLMMVNEMSPYLLLGFLVAGLMAAFVPTSLYAKHLAGTGLSSVIKAALLGIPLPLCSCGVLPTAVSLRKNGASRAASTSFLIATPQTGVDSIAATYSLLGPAFAIIRPVAALITALVGGKIVGLVESNALNDKLPKTDEHCSCDDNHSECHCDGCDDDDDDCHCSCGDHCDCHDHSTEHLSFVGKLKLTFTYGFIEMMQNIGKWLVIGLIVAALITVLVPDNFFTTYAKYPLFNMLVVLIVAVPMYICATGSIPIALSLMLKGLTPGAALVMLMAGPAANMASALVISKAFGKKPTIAYLCSIIGGAIAFGLIADYLLPREWFTSAIAPLAHNGCHDHNHASIFSTICSVVLVALLIVSFALKYVKSNEITKNKTTKMKEYKIRGMECNHCKNNVETNLAKLDGVTKVTVDLAKGIAYVEGNHDSKTVIDTINSLGYKYVE